jgi:hypothetical protein
MSRKGDLLALRRDVLVARSAMLRLRAARDVEALRESLSFSGIAASVAASVAGSRRARSVAFGTLLVFLGGRRLSKAVRFAAAVLAGAKLVRFVRRYAARRPAAATSSQSTEATS